ncbi:MAG: DegV family protein [Mycoplasmataceae bacterium]|nr:DegV family protein [Mycoplasmataceae bacterium]
MKNKYAILVDSSCTYDQKWLEEHDVKIIPLSISDGKNNVYPDDGQAIKITELLERLDNNEVFKTSVTPVGQVIEKVENLLREYEAVIFLPITRGVSSQYQQALMIQKDFENKLFVVDTQTGAAAIEFMVERLVREMHNDSSKTPQQLVEIANNMRNQLPTYFSCENLNGLIRSGRAKTALKAVNFLRFKPVLRINVGIELAGLGRNFKVNMQKMISHIKSRYKDLKDNHQKIKKVALYYSLYSDEKKHSLLKIIAEGLQFPISQIRIRLLPSVILVHTLAGAYGLTVEITD